MHYTDIQIPAAVPNLPTTITAMSTQHSARTGSGLLNEHGHEHEREHDADRHDDKHTRAAAALLDGYHELLSRRGLALAPHQAALVSEWLATLAAAAPSETVLPLAQLLTASVPRGVHVGTGLSVTEDVLGAAIAGARSSVVLVTCFWAASPSRDVLATALRRLARRASSEAAAAAAAGQQRRRPVTVRIGFSSSSAAQKLLHTASPRGRTHAPAAWAGLGLPAPAELAGGVDLAIKSLFFRPLSVLHGKFAIVDGTRLFLPSANVSWEVWLELCTTFSGPIVGVFQQFWETVWAAQDPAFLPVPSQAQQEGDGDGEREREREREGVQGVQRECEEDGEGGGQAYPTLFLPQPHHRNPSFSFPFSLPFTLSSPAPSPATPFLLPSPPPPSASRPVLPNRRRPRRRSVGEAAAQTDGRPPCTPQNAFVLLALARARHSVYLQTPNLTSRPLVRALARALARGVTVQVVTCRRMMVLEQLLTTAAQASTEGCVAELLASAANSSGGGGGDGGRGGQLEVWYFTPPPDAERESGAANGGGEEAGEAWDGDGDGRIEDEAGDKGQVEESPLARYAVQSHVKALIVDDDVAVLGSANGDRASWYTSQEVNVAVFSRPFARRVRRALQHALRGRLQRAV